MQLSELIKSIELKEENFEINKENVRKEFRRAFIDYIRKFERLDLMTPEREQYLMQIFEYIDDLLIEQ